MLGIGAVIAAELFDGSIRGRHQLSGVVASHLLISVPYIATRGDIVRTRLRVVVGAVSVVILVAALGGLAAAIVFGLPLDFSWLDMAEIGFRATGAGH
jgi:hypothetical protein